MTAHTADKTAERRPKNGARALSRKHVHGARLIHRVIGLVAVDAGGRAVFAAGADYESAPIAAQRDRFSELVVGLVFEPLMYACCAHIVPVRANR